MGDFLTAAILCMLGLSLLVLCIALWVLVRRWLRRSGDANDDGAYDIDDDDPVGDDADNRDQSGDDRHGYDRHGYDRYGYDRSGYNRDGYDRLGKDTEGRYNRLFDRQAYAKGLLYSPDGFLDPHRYSIAVTDHARKRILERIPSGARTDAKRLAEEAYCFGKSRRQIKRTSAPLIEDIEERYEDGIVLIYRGFIYIFASDNVLVTVYRNERIPPVSGSSGAVRLRGGDNTSQISERVCRRENVMGKEALYVFCIQGLFCGEKHLAGSRLFCCIVQEKADKYQTLWYIGSN